MKILRKPYLLLFAALALILVACAQTAEAQPQSGDAPQSIGTSQANACAARMRHACWWISCMASACNSRRNMTLPILTRARSC